MLVRAHLQNKTNQLSFGDCKELFKNPRKCLWCWEPDRRSNFFFSAPGNLCAVTFINEILLIVRLTDQSTLLFPIR